MIIKECVITNNIGDSIEFGRHFKLLEGFDLSGLKATINYSETSRDGANYQNTLLDIRDIDLVFYLDNRGRDAYWIESKRKEVFTVLNPKYNPMRLDFKTKSGEEYYLTVNLESVPSLPQKFEDSNGAWQKAYVQFSCDDPYIYEKDARQIDIATWIKKFKFPLKLKSEGIKMGARSQSLFVNAYNAGQTSTGMLIRFKANATVLRPALINVNTYEELRLNITMSQGDEIEVSTYEGDMYITLIRDNVRTNIFNAIDLYSHFLQLDAGDNLLRYEAETGVDNLEVRLIYRAKSVGV